MTTTAPSKRIAVDSTFLRRVRDAVGYSYEAGDYPDDMPVDVHHYVQGDGGLLSTLNLAISLLEDRERGATLPQLRDYLITPVPEVALTVGASATSP